MPEIRLVARFISFWITATNDSRMRRLSNTSKPLKLLWSASFTRHPEGDLVLDPFCGSGTTLVAAKRLGKTSGSIPTKLSPPT